jgi:hypothetical protein
MEKPMKTKNIGRLVLAAAVAALVLTAAPPAFADDPLILPVGLGCPDFNLGLLGTGGNLPHEGFRRRE